MQLRTRHPWDRDVKNQALGSVGNPRLEEFLCGRKRIRGEPQFVKQARQGFPHRLIIIDDGYKNCGAFHVFLKPARSITRLAPASIATGTQRFSARASRSLKPEVPC